MDKQEMEQLTSAEHLSAELRGIFIDRLKLLVGTAQAYKTNESPIAGKKLADVIQLLERTTEEAGADRLITILPLLVELVADSLVELIAENNRRLLSAMSGA